MYAMAEITVKCPKCDNAIKVQIKTIDNLRAELQAMTDDRDYYKRKLAALECMNKANPADDLFSSIFKGL